MGRNNHVHMFAPDGDVEAHDALLYRANEAIAEVGAVAHDSLVRELPVVTPPTG